MTICLMTLKKIVDPASQILKIIFGFKNDNSEVPCDTNLRSSLQEIMCSVLLQDLFPIDKHTQMMILSQTLHF